MESGFAVSASDGGTASMAQVRYLSLFMALTLMLALGACTASAGPASGRPVQKVAVEVNVSDGPEAPDWVLETLDGGEFRLADHRGEVVVMFFMASWCSSCLLEARALDQLYRQYKDQGLTVVAINVEPGRPVQELARFRQMANDADYSWAFDSEFAVVKRYGVRALDSTIIIDRAGRIAYTDDSLTPLETLESEILKWL
uniref:TlpA family protein disulfide reductase n=2 Tax=Litorilinea aerophila TaxID=1204385 RepID=A0A540V9T0_9CHLR